MKKVLLTGANGYIGMRLLPVLLDKGYYVVCAVRDKRRYIPVVKDPTNYEVIEMDVTDVKTLSNIPHDIDIAFYLIHSMSASLHDYDQIEADSATNFLNAIEKTNTQQVIYLGAITNSLDLSKHLSSRKKVETILARGRYAFTTLRAGIVIGSGSASFEIVRDLSEKLPIMIAPKWLNTKTQPVAIRNVLQYLSGCILQPYTYNKIFDIGGTDVLTYKEMLLTYAKVRGLKRYILTIPVFSPRLSSYWLYFVTSVSYKLASNLVDSMKIEVIAKKNNLDAFMDIEPLSYVQALELTFQKIAQNEIVSSWKDAMLNNKLHGKLSPYMQVPTHGCFTDKRIYEVESYQHSVDKIWKIGGETGWYYATKLWSLRGFLDRLFGGVGLRRGRTNPETIHPGDALDFWRVIVSDKSNARLLLYAEMRLPGEAWLEFKIEDGNLYQTATFRPKGVWGRMYWYIFLPFHNFIFKNMAYRIATNLDIQ